MPATCCFQKRNHLQGQLSEAMGESARARTVAMQAGMRAHPGRPFLAACMKSPESLRLRSKPSFFSPSALALTPNSECCVQWMAGRDAGRVGRRHRLPLPLVYAPILWYFSAEAGRRQLATRVQRCTLFRSAGGKRPSARHDYSEARSRRRAKIRAGSETRRPDHHMQTRSACWMGRACQPLTWCAVTGRLV